MFFFFFRGNGDDLWKLGGNEEEKHNLKNAHIFHEVAKKQQHPPTRLHQTNLIILGILSKGCPTIV